MQGTGFFDRLGRIDGLPKGNRRKQGKVVSNNLIPPCFGGPDIDFVAFPHVPPRANHACSGGGRRIRIIALAVLWETYWYVGLARSLVEPMMYAEPMRKTRWRLSCGSLNACPVATKLYARSAVVQLMR